LYCFAGTQLLKAICTIFKDGTSGKNLNLPYPIKEVYIVGRVFTTTKSITGDNECMLFAQCLINLILMREKGGPSHTGIRKVATHQDIVFAALFPVTNWTGMIGWILLLDRSVMETLDSEIKSPHILRLITNLLQLDIPFQILHMWAEAVVC